MLPVALVLKGIEKTNHVTDRGAPDQKIVIYSRPFWKEITYFVVSFVNLFLGNTTNFMVSEIFLLMWVIPIGP